jgi:hypothetical protein
MGVVSGLPRVTQLSGRETNFCGLGADRRVYWGWTGNGALLAANVTGLTTRPSEVVTP